MEPEFYHVIFYSKPFSTRWILYPHSSTSWYIMNCFISSFIVICFVAIRIIQKTVILLFIFYDRWHRWIYGAVHWGERNHNVRTTWRYSPKRLQVTLYEEMIRSIHCCKCQINTKINHYVFPQKSFVFLL